MKALAAAVLAFFGIGYAALPPAPATVLQFTPHAVNQLAFLLVGQTHEVKLCLLGFRAGDTSVVADFYMPRHYESSATGVRADVCVPPAFADLHIHPQMRIALPDECDLYNVGGADCADARLLVLHGPRSNCAMSAKDRIAAAHSRYMRWHVVWVTPTTICWWTRDEAIADTTATLPAVRGQRTW